MKKSEIIDALVEKTGLTKTEVTKVYEGTFELIKEELGKGNDVAVSGFGTFKTVDRAERNGINPLTKEPLKIPARKSVTFKAGSALKEIVNK